MQSPKSGGMNRKIDASKGIAGIYQALSDSYEEGAETSRKMWKVLAHPIIN